MGPGGIDQVETNGPSRWMTCEVKHFINPVVCVSDGSDTRVVVNVRV